MTAEQFRQRAALRVAWAARALNAAGDDLKDLGATDAADAVWDEAVRLEGLAMRVHELASAPNVEQPVMGVVF